MDGLELFQQGRAGAAPADVTMAASCPGVQKSLGRQAKTPTLAQGTPSHRETQRSATRARASYHCTLGSRGPPSARSSLGLFLASWPQTHRLQALGCLHWSTACCSCMKGWVFGVGKLWHADLEMAARIWAAWTGA